VIEGLFEVKGKDRDAAVLFNLVDELTYRAQSNLGPQAFRKLKKGMIIIGRLVPIGEVWMVSGNLSAYPASARDEMLVAIHFVEGEGMSFYPDYHLLEELFGNPALIARRRYRETLSGFLYDPDTSPEPLRQFAARDPAKANKVFTRLLKHKGFSWDADGEALLRELKPSYFDGTLYPRTVVLSEPLSKALRDARHLTARTTVPPEISSVISLDITEVEMTDILIRDVPEDVIAAVDAHAGRLGLSRSEYVRRRLAQDAARQDSPVSVEDLARFADVFGDLADPDVMSQAWR